MFFSFRRYATGADFLHPLPAAPKTAILRGGFQETKRVRAFARGWCDEAARFEPTCVAGSLRELRPLIHERVELEHGLVVFTSDPEDRLTEDDRNWLWDVFGVPIFEQVLGADNRLLAAECEAHGGLHIVGNMPREELDPTPCECGNPAPRLMERKPALVMAAVGTT